MYNDLIFVLKQIKTAVESFNLPDLYTNFSNTLQQISSSSTPELQEALKDYKTKIKQAHDALVTDSWSYSQIEVLTKFGANKQLGKEGWEKFQNALTDNSANTPGAIEELNKQKQDITQIVANANNILNSLGGLAEEKELASEGEVVIQIVFDEKVSIDTLIDLTKQSEEWADIIRAFSLYAGKAPETTRIVGTSKNSPYTIWLVSAKFIGDMICSTIKPFLGLYKEVLELKEHALALENMKIGIDSEKFELLKKIDEYERKRIGEIMENVAELNKNANLADSERNEAKNALLKAGPKLYGFITSGGRVDISKTDETGKVSNSYQLESSYKEVKALDSKIQNLLEASTKKKDSNKKDKALEQTKVESSIKPKEPKKDA